MIELVNWPLNSNDYGIALTLITMTAKKKPDKPKYPHWLSRNAERITTPILTAVGLSIIYFGYGWLVVEPEHEETKRRVEVQERLVELLTESVAQSSKSITQLATDRAGAVYGGSTAAIARLEQSNRGKPFDEWDTEDQRLYEAAKTQLRSAEERLGIR